MKQFFPTSNLVFIFFQHMLMMNKKAFQIFYFFAYLSKLCRLFLEVGKVKIKIIENYPFWDQSQHN